MKIAHPGMGKGRPSGAEQTLLLRLLTSKHLGYYIKVNGKKVIDGNDKAP